MYAERLDMESLVMGLIVDTDNPTTVKPDLQLAPVWHDERLNGGGETIRKPSRRPFIGLIPTSQKTFVMKNLDFALDGHHRAAIKDEGDLILKRCDVV